MSTGTLPLNSVISLKNVLGVPSFKVDLMSISQVTRGLNCSVTFSLLVWVNNKADFITWLH
jgi:hypothetical protein